MRNVDEAPTLAWYSQLAAGRFLRRPSPQFLVPSFLCSESRVCSDSFRRTFRSQTHPLTTMPRFFGLSTAAMVVVYALLASRPSQAAVAVNSTSTASSRLAGCWSGETKEACRRRQCKRERKKGTLAPMAKCSPPNLRCVYNIITCYQWVEASQSCRNSTIVSTCDCDSLTGTWSCRQGDCPRRPKDPRCR
jgi:hypothetical protein